MLDLVGSIIEFENGELDDVGTISLFAALIKSGQAWSLQGSYGRTAKSLIDAGIITNEGEINQEKLDEILEQ